MDFASLLSEAEATRLQTDLFTTVYYRPLSKLADECRSLRQRSRRRERSPQTDSSEQPGSTTTAPSISSPISSRHQQQSSTAFWQEFRAKGEQALKALDTKGQLVGNETNTIDR
jgi:hypothetical protein